jgi:methionyl-tRNA synthetase
VRWLNRYVESTAPWQLAKDEARADELDAVLYDLADGVRAVAVALSPYLPETTPLILGALGQPVELELERVAYGVTPPTDGIAAAAPLFPRVDQPTAAA